MREGATGRSRIGWRVSIENIKRKKLRNFFQWEWEQIEWEIGFRKIPGSPNRIWKESPRETPRQVPRESKESMWNRSSRPRINYLLWDMKICGIPIILHTFRDGLIEDSKVHRLFSLRSWRNISREDMSSRISLRINRSTLKSWTNGRRTFTILFQMPISRILHI